jgi:hypothetical protein
VVQLLINAQTGQVESSQKQMSGNATRQAGRLRGREFPSTGPLTRNNLWFFFVIRPEPMASAEITSYNATSGYQSQQLAHIIIRES